MLARGDTGGAQQGGCPRGKCSASHRRAPSTRTCRRSDRIIDGHSVQMGEDNPQLSAADPEDPPSPLDEAEQPLLISRTVSGIEVGGTFEDGVEQQQSAAGDKEEGGGAGTGCPGPAAFGKVGRCRRGLPPRAAAASSRGGVRDGMGKARIVWNPSFCAWCNRSVPTTPRPPAHLPKQARPARVGAGNR